jgi:phenylacetate-CoA ligase
LDLLSLKLYRHSPIWVQELLVSTKSVALKFLREGRRYDRFLRAARETQWLSKEDVEAYQRDQLASLLRHALDTVPYYRSRHGADFDRLLEDQAETALERLPLMEKSALRSEQESLLSTAARRPLFRAATSGSTGSPLHILQDLDAVSREQAFLSRQRQWLGFQQGDRRAWIRGDMVVPFAQQAPPFWRFDRMRNDLLCSSYHLSMSNASHYLAMLREFDPHLIEAYPSSVGFLASILNGIGETYGGRSLKGIMVSSETLSDERRHEIERAFSCRVFNWYGQVERVAAFGTCEYGRYHVLEDYSYVEFLPVERDVYEVVGTGFNNYSMPLIRYRTGDFVRLSPESRHCPCGRSFRTVQHIDGRGDDIVTLQDGRRIGQLNHVAKGVPGLIESQIIQDAIDRIRILVVPGPKFGEQSKALLLDQAKERLGDDVSIQIKIVDAIPRAGRGKQKAVVRNF